MSLVSVRGGGPGAGSAGVVKGTAGLVVSSGRGRALSRLGGCCVVFGSWRRLGVAAGGRYAKTSYGARWCDL